MNQGLGESRDISETEPPPMHKSTSLEQRAYSDKYTELNDFLQENYPSQFIRNKIRTYFKIGMLAKQGFEKASEVYDPKSFNESCYLLEKGQTPTLLHRHALIINRFDKNFVEDKLRDFEGDIKEIAFKYRAQVEKRLEKKLVKDTKLTHFEGIDYVLKNCRNKGIKTRNDVIEALMLAQAMGLEVTIHRWYKELIDNKKVGSVIIDFFNRHYKGNKTEVYNKIKDEISKKFGMKMDKSTFYRYIRENRPSIELTPTPETDISEPQSNVG